MTNAVAATSTAVPTGDTQRTQTARSTGTSYAEVQAAAAKGTDAKPSSKSSGDAPKGERTQAVAGHSYKEIVSGPRNGMFINNTGLTPAGAGTSGSVTVHLQAYANSTGNATGTPKDLVIGAGQTASVSDVLHVLSVPAGEDTILVTATVTSGSAAIAGAAVQIDQTTKDGSVVDMNRGDF